MKKLKLIIAAAIITLTLTGCSNPLFEERNRLALAPIIESPPPGFTVSENGKPTCGIDYCNSNYGFIFTSDSTSTDRPEFCSWFVEWAVGKGADSWMSDPNYIAIPIKGHEGTAQIACIGAMNFSLLGGKLGEPRWMMSAGPAQFTVETIMNREGGIDDSRMVYHEWDEAIALLFSGTRADMSALDLVNSYRLANPNEDPNSPKTIEKALKSFPSIKLDETPELEIIEDKDGKAKYLFIKKDSVMLARCLNIKPFDSEYFKIDNPGTGFVGMYLTEEAPVVDQFGYMTTGTCRQ